MAAEREFVPPGEKLTRIGENLKQTSFNPSQIFVKLLERSRPALRHAGVRIVERLALLVRRIQRQPFDGDGGFAFAFSERRFGKHLQRPGRAHRMPRQTAFLIRKRIYKDNFLRRDDFAINKFAPHFFAIDS